MRGSHRQRKSHSRDGEGECEDTPSRNGPEPLRQSVDVYYGLIYCQVFCDITSQYYKIYSKYSRVGNMA